MARPIPRPAPVTSADAPRISIPPSIGRRSEDGKEPRHRGGAPSALYCEEPRPRREVDIEYKDYYKILGVTKDASAKEIKAAYRRLARKYHPDVNQGDVKAEARFKEVNEANEVLSDADKRKRYDELGSDWARYQSTPAGGPFGGGRVRVDSSGFGGDFSDFFRTFFSGGFGGGAPGGFSPDFEGGRGSDVEHEIELTLEEVARGTTRLLGFGAAGSKGHRKVEVKIPVGVREGSRVRVAGEGGSGRKQGDLYLRVRITPHPLFERRGEDLLASAAVPLTTAVLGGEVTVPTLEGPVGIKVPPGTAPGRTFRLRGHGLPRLEGGDRGDVLATLSVSIPKDLSVREKELFEELRALGR
jgi:DnaJ-class molecular chaperone